MHNPNSTRSLRRWLAAPAVVGALVGGYGIAAAQSGTTSVSSTPSTDQATTTTVAPTPSDSAGSSGSSSADSSGQAETGRTDGRGETALTGDTADKVRAAATKAVPGATVDRVETDSDGSAYEAHLTKADGTHVTVKVNDAFEVTSVDNDPASGSRGDHRGPGGGSGETAVTGDTADKVWAAAIKSVPDATVDRVETDSDGSPYEAHMTKADGTHVTVKVNDAFEVTSVDNDPTSGPRS
ncbi:MAG: hypothetical protein QOE35_398 [Actinomycetota bacterium]|jgi:hypothetical protein